MKPVRNRLLAIGVVTFFLGFPAVGLVMSWNYAHSLIRRSSDQFVNESVLTILNDESAKTLDDFGTLYLRESKDENAYVSDRKGLGKAMSFSLKIAHSWADDRKDNIFQFVEYKGNAEFEAGARPFKIIVARRTMNPEWRVDSISLTAR